MKQDNSIFLNHVLRDEDDEFVSDSEHHSSSKAKQNNGDGKFHFG